MELGADINAVDSKALQMSCINGHLEIDEWLVDLGIDFTRGHNGALRYSCQRGRLDKAKWLVCLGANICDLENYAFRSACANGHLETAQWLVDMGADIHAKNDDAVRLSLKEKHYGVVKWLNQLDNNIISRFIKDNKGPIEYDLIGISKETGILFECIRKNEPFPKIDDVEDCIIYSLAHYNMIDHLVKLRDQFPFINFGVVGKKIE